MNKEGDFIVISYSYVCTYAYLNWNCIYTEYGSVRMFNWHRMVWLKTQDLEEDKKNWQKLKNVVMKEEWHRCMSWQVKRISRLNFTLKWKDIFEE